jgi:hypothetical protein
MTLDIVYLADGPAGQGWYWTTDDGVLHGPWATVDAAAADASATLVG